MLRTALLAASLSTLAFSVPAAATQAARPDTFQAPMGFRHESDMMKPFVIGVRDENGNRIIINGRPVSAGGSTLSAPGTIGSTGRSMPGSTLGRSTLSAVAIGNSITINNVRNSVIVIDQQNLGAIEANAGVGSSDGE